MGEDRGHGKFSEVPLLQNAHLAQLNDAALQALSHQPTAIRSHCLPIHLRRCLLNAAQTGAPLGIFQKKSMC